MDKLRINFRLLPLSMKARLQHTPKKESKTKQALPKVPRLKKPMNLSKIPKKPKRPKLQKPPKHVKLSISSAKPQKLKPVKETQHLVEPKSNKEPVVETKAPEKMFKALQEMPGHEFLETKIDKLLLLIQKKGKLSTDEASALLKTSKQLIEDWAQILSDQKLITLDYPSINKTIMIKKEKEID